MQWTPQQIADMTFQQLAAMANKNGPGAPITTDSFEAMTPYEQQYLAEHTPEASMMRAERMLELERIRWQKKD